MKNFPLRLPVSLNCGGIEGRKFLKTKRMAPAILLTILKIKRRVEMRLMLVSKGYIHMQYFERLQLTEYTNIFSC